MGLVTSHPAGTTRPPSVFPARGREAQRSRIEIVDNPVAAEDPALGRALEHEVRRLLKADDVGPVAVRFRICRDETEGLRFICKVENPPFDGEDGRVQWRWWSPLMETADQFRSALTEGLRVRRERQAGALR